MILVDDHKTDWKLSQVFPDLALRWKASRDFLFKETGKQIKITDALRSFEDQWMIWSQGRFKTKDGKWLVSNKKLIVTHAMPGHSFHQYGLAIDSAFMGSDPYLQGLSDQESKHVWDLYGSSLRSQGLEWGGDWSGVRNDRPHCQITYELSIDDVQIIYEAKGMSGVWDKCSINLLKRSKAHE